MDTRCIQANKNRTIRVALHHRGMTLIEMMIALSILSVILIVSYSIVAAGMRVYKMNTDSIQAQSSGRLALMQITRDIRQLDTEDDYESIQFEEDSGNGEKVLSIGPDVTYRLDPIHGILTRSFQESINLLQIFTIEGIGNLEVILDPDLPDRVQIEIESRIDSKIIQTTILFREG